MHLNDAQIVALDAMASRQGVSRADAVQRLVDRAISDSPADTGADLTLIEESFGAMRDALTSDRGPGERAAHLNRIDPS